MPLLSDYARHRKRRFFLDRIPRGARVLEVGCGDGWVGDCLRGRTRYEGIDIVPPADIVGDIRDWQALGLQPGAYDAIIAFELIEHVDAWDAFRRLLKAGGVLMVTTPLPRMDGLLRLLERIGLNQRRTSPHDHLTDLNTVAGFSSREIRIVGGMAQWAIFHK